MVTLFEPNTYRKQRGKPNGVPQAAKLPKGKGRNKEEVLKCPGCVLWVPPDRLTDVRMLPHPVTGGASWLCDGCIQRLIREGVQIAPGKLVSEVTLAEAFGAPQDVIDNLTEALERRRRRFNKIDARFKAAGDKRGEPK